MYENASKYFTNDRKTERIITDKKEATASSTLFLGKRPINLYCAIFLSPKVTNRMARCAYMTQ